MRSDKQKQWKDLSPQEMRNLARTNVIRINIMIPILAFLAIWFLNFNDTFMHIMGWGIVIVLHYLGWFALSLWARYKGHSGAWGLLALLSLPGYLIGIIIMLCLPDKHPKTEGVKEPEVIKAPVYSNAVHEVRANPKFCMSCGAELPEGSRLCQNCGKQIHVSPPMSPDTTTVVRPATQPVMPVPANKPVTPFQPQAAPQKPWLQRNWGWILIAVIFFIGLQANLRGGGDAGLQSFFNDIFGGGSSGVSSGGSGSGGSGSQYGTLSVSSNGGDIYVNGRYLCRGSGTISLPPGSYKVTCNSASTGKLVWQANTTIVSGKTSIVKNDMWAR